MLVKEATGNAMSQGIGSVGIDWVLPEYSGHSTIEGLFEQFRFRC